MKVLVVVLVCCVLTIGLQIKNESNKQQRIIRGNIARDGQFPYQARLSMGCGGSIISKNAILTAAHCLDNISPRDIRVYLGNVTRYAGDKYAVDQAVIHPSYFHNHSVTLGDIGILKLKKNIIFKKNVQKIELETREVGEEDAIVVGWGYIDTYGSVLVDTLQYFSTKTISLEQCRREHYPHYIDTKQICTETNIGGPCRGDSGSPLVSKGKQIGSTSYLISSFGPAICLTHYPRIYTKVSSYVDWISSYVKQWE